LSVGRGSGQVCPSTTGGAMYRSQSA